MKEKEFEAVLDNTRRGLEKADAIRQDVVITVPAIKIMPRHIGYFIATFITVSLLSGFYLYEKHKQRERIIKAWISTEFGSAKNGTYNPLDSFLASTDAKQVVEQIAKARDSDAVTAGFKGIADQLNLTVIRFIASELGISQSDTAAILDEYYKRNSVVIDNIHKSMVVAKSSLATGRTDTIYKNYNAVNSFADSIAGYACDFAALPTLSKLQTTLSDDGEDGDLLSFSLKMPCVKILSQSIIPIINYLKDQAIIQDVEVIKVTLEGQLRNSVLQLATAEDAYDFNVHDAWSRTVDLIFWKPTSTTSIDAAVKAHVKAGFDLKEKFSMEVNHNDKKIIIKLPRPTILSNEIYMTFDQAREGWIAPSPNSSMYNSMHDQAQSKALEYANNGNIMESARQSAVKSLHNIFDPIMALPQFNYTVEVVVDDGDGILLNDVKQENRL
jgi:hypothetical protein